MANKKSVSNLKVRSQHEIVVVFRFAKNSLVAQIKVV